MHEFNLYALEFNGIAYKIAFDRIHTGETTTWCATITDEDLIKQIGSRFYWNTTASGNIEFRDPIGDDLLKNQFVIAVSELLLEHLSKK